MACQPFLDEYRWFGQCDCAMDDKHYFCFKSPMVRYRHGLWQQEQCNGIAGQWCSARMCLVVERVLLLSVLLSLDLSIDGTHDKYANLRLRDCYPQGSN